MAREVFSVRGMHCRGCEKLLQLDIGALAGVRSVRADHRAGTVEVEGEGFDAGAVKKAIEQNGYSI